MKKPGVRKHARFLYVSKVSNDSGGYHVMRVIANQCAHWCGNLF